MTPEEQVASIGGAVDKILAKYQKPLSEAVDYSTPSDRRPMFRLLSSMADDLCKGITPNTVCANGCSHCCYQSVQVSLTEATAISAYLKKDLNHVDYPPSLEAAYRYMLHSQRKHRGVACVFLNRGKCAIYPVRPLACKLHFSLESDTSLCDGTKYPNGTVATLAMIEVQQLVFAALFDPPFMDIRDYFPAYDHGDA